MIPSVWAVLIYQILAFIGIDAISQAVTYIAYRKQDLDIKLMYSQKPLDIIYNYNRFRKSTIQKIIIIILALLALSLGFLPTLFTKLNQSTYIYSETERNVLAQVEPSWSTIDMPVIDDFLRFTQDAEEAYPTAKTIMENYLKNKLQQNMTSNPTGLWYRTRPKAPFKFSNDQYGSIDGFFTWVKIPNPGTGLTVRTFTAFGSRASDSQAPTSSSLQSCSKDPLNLITNITSKEGFQIEAVRTYEYACYPMYDRASAVYVINTMPNKLSMLSVNDNIYRSSQLSPGVTALGSFGVSIFNHNKTHISMGIKKMASITFFNYQSEITPPSNCSRKGKFVNATQDFKNLPNNYMLCYLLDMMPKWNDTVPKIRMIQATRKYYEQNRAMNVVYTIQNGIVYEEGQSVMIDLNMFAVYNLEGQLADDKEYLVAYETKSYGSKSDSLTNNTFENTLDNDNVEYILNHLDSTPLTYRRIDIFATIASMRARWTHQDFSDFIKVTADVTGAVETTPEWIVAVVLLFVIFLLPQLTRIFVRRNPYYAKDFRTILISTLENTNDSTSSTAKRISIISKSEEDGNIVALCIDGSLIQKVKPDDEKSLIDDDRTIENK